MQTRSDPDQKNCYLQFITQNCTSHEELAETMLKRITMKSEKNLRHNQEHFNFCI